MQEGDRRTCVVDGICFILEITKADPMKKILLSIVIISLVTMSFSVIVSDEKASANVNQVQGLYIFQQCKPVKETEYLGSVKKSVSLTGKPSEMLNSMIKKAKKEYPQCQAIIFVDDDMDKVDCVKFK